MFEKFKKNSILYYLFRKVSLQGKWKKVTCYYTHQLCYMTDLIYDNVRLEADY